MFTHAQHAKQENADADRLKFLGSRATQNHCSAQPPVYIDICNLQHRFCPSFRFCTLHKSVRPRLRANTHKSSSADTFTDIKAHHIQYTAAL